MRPGVVPTLTRIFDFFDKSSALFSLSCFRVRASHSRTPPSSWLDSFFQRNSPIANPASGLAPFVFVLPLTLTITLPADRSAPCTPLLLAHAPGRFPLLALIHLYLLHSSPRYILFCVVWGFTRLPPSRPHGAVQTTKGRTVAGRWAPSDIRSRSTSTTSSGRDGGGRHLPFHAQPPKLIPRFSSCCRRRYLLFFAPSSSRAYHLAAGGTTYSKNHGPCAPWGRVLARLEIEAQ